MSYSVRTNSIWKWITIDGSVMQVFYWDDFNPVQFSRPSSLSSVWTTWTTTNFDLSWFQPWHEVWCHVRLIDLGSSYSWTLYWEFLRSSDWNSWQNLWTMAWDVSASSWQYWAWYAYFWVDWDEIWDWYNYYKMHLTWLSDIDFESPTFTVSNLNIDSTDHYAWYIRVEWSHLCFVDASHYYRWTYGREWFKHKIAYDGNFSQYVWTEYSWMMWLETDVVRRIYYVDQYWYKRRTYEASNRFWYPSWQWKSVWSNYKWKIYVSDSWDAEDWYAHLCFVNQNWYLMRILNWPPSWVA